jgi:hypothetical protein
MSSSFRCYPAAHINLPVSRFSTGVRIAKTRRLTNWRDLLCVFAFGDVAEMTPVRTPVHAERINR